MASTGRNRTRPGLSFVQPETNASQIGVLARESQETTLGTLNPLIVKTWTMDLKGKGPTEARFLLSRDGASYGGPPTSSRSTEVTVRP